MIAILLAKEGARARCDRILNIHDTRRDGRIGEHGAIGDIFDAAQLLGRNGLGMREVEAQTIRRDERALLRDMIAEHLPQRLMQQMGGGMIGAQRAAARMIDTQFERETSVELAFFDRALMDIELAKLFLRIGDAEDHARRLHHARVATADRPIRHRRASG